MKNLPSYLGIVIVGLIIYFSGSKWGGGSSVSKPVERGKVDPAIEIYQHFTESRAKHEYDLPKKMATGAALKKLLKEKANNRTGSGSDMNLLFLKTKFKKVSAKHTGDPARKSYTIKEERLMNQDNSKGVGTRKKFFHQHEVTMVRKDRVWLVSDFEDETE